MWKKFIPIVMLLISGACATGAGHGISSTANNWYRIDKNYLETDEDLKELPGIGLGSRESISSLKVHSTYMKASSRTAWQ